MLEGDRGGVVCILNFGEILKKYVSPLHHMSTEILSEYSKQSSKKSVFTSWFYFVCSSIAKYFRMVYEMDDFLQKNELELNVTQKVASKGFVQPTGLILLTFEGWWQI